MKNNTNNLDLFYFNLISEYLTTTKHICSHKNLRYNIVLTYFNSFTGRQCHSCYRNMKPYFLKKSSILVSFFFPYRKSSCLDLQVNRPFFSVKEYLVLIF